MISTAIATSNTIFKTAIRFPLRVIWFLLRHPILSVLFALLISWSVISSLALFNPAIATHFNDAVAYFGGATAASFATDQLRQSIKAKERRIAELDNNLKKAKTDLRTERARTRNSGKIRAELDETRAANAQLKTKVKDQQTLLSNQEKQVRNMEFKLKRSNQSLAQHNQRLQRFGQTGKKIESRMAKRFTKVALYDTAGEFLGFLPILGDAASIGLSVGGLVEMCNMFKEIEHATTELHVPFRIWSGTFCEDPTGKSKEVIMDATIAAKDTINQRFEWTRLYWKYKLNAWSNP